MQNIRLDAGAAALLARLHGAGYAAYAVGGCCLLYTSPSPRDCS